MHIRGVKLALAFLASVGLSACGYNINPYGASVTNVEAIKGQGLNKVSVEKFDSYMPGRTSISCRAAGPVQVPESLDFESYIQKALVDELKLAGAYSADSPLVLKGRIEELDFNSNIGAGKWVMKMTLSSRTKPGYTVESQHEFSTNWVADKACQQVAQAFPPAVQQLIFKVVSDPRLKNLAQ